MFIDITNGNIKIDEVLIHKGYTLDDFRKTSLFSNQKSIDYIQLGKHCVGNKNFFISIMFKNMVISCISLSLDDSRCKSWHDEPKLKLIHDGFLNSEGIIPNKDYGWGKIESVFDERGGFSTIIISYQEDN